MTMSRDRFELGRFFPYQLAVLAERVSLAISQLYAGRFDISRVEWRVLAALGAHNGMSAKDIAPYSALDKMQVSRAVARLEEEGFIERREDAADRRAKILELTPAGRVLFQKIVPLVRAREDYLLDALDADERLMLDRIMNKILVRAEGLIERG